MKYIILTSVLCIAFTSLSLICIGQTSDSELSPASPVYEAKEVKSDPPVIPVISDVLKENFGEAKMNEILANSQAEVFTPVANKSEPADKSVNPDLDIPSKKNKK